MVSDKNKYSSISLLAGELERRGFKAERIELLQSWMRFTAPNGRVWMTPRSFVDYPFLHAAAKHISVDKRTAYRLVAELGVRIPDTLELPEDEDMLDAFLADFSPLVVKPVDSYGSKGTTLGVKSKEELNAAVAAAAATSPLVLVQRQVTGQEVRITILNDAVVSAILRETPSVIGDGNSTCRELLHEENKARQASGHEYLRYPALNEELIRKAGSSPDTVLPIGERLELGRSTMVSRGASLHEISDQLHPSYAETALQLARQINPAFMVVDMMIDDYRAPLSSANYSFIEFNTAPALRMYYGVRSGTPYDIVSALADTIEGGLV